MGFYSLVDNRAWKALHLVADDFKSFASVTAKKHNFVEMDGCRMGVKDMSASYAVTNKWMGRIYVFRWQCRIPDAKSANNLKIVLKYSGSWGKRDARFFSKSSSSLVDSLNSDQKLMEICRTIDFERLEIQYSAAEKAWRLEVRPNYGDFIWMLIPPVRYMRRPKEPEIKQTVELIRSISRHINKQ